MTDESIPRKNYKDLDEEEQNFEQTLILISGATSYEQLKDFTRKHFKYMDNHFMCEACSQSFAIVDINERKKFSNLKVSLKRHLTLPHHIQNVKTYMINLQNKKKEFAEAESYALTCAKTAYLCLKENIAYDSYPYMIQLIYSSGGNVGHQQHSRQFIIRFLP